MGKKGRGECIGRELVIRRCGKKKERERRKTWKEEVRKKLLRREDVRRVK